MVLNCHRMDVLLVLKVVLPVIMGNAIGVCPILLLSKMMMVKLPAKPSALFLAPSVLIKSAKNAKMATLSKINNALLMTVTQIVVIACLAPMTLIQQTQYSVLNAS